MLSIIFFRRAGSTFQTPSQSPFFVKQKYIDGSDLNVLVALTLVASSLWSYFCGGAALAIKHSSLGQAHSSLGLFIKGL